MTHDTRDMAPEESHGKVIQFTCNGRVNEQSEPSLQDDLGQISSFLDGASGRKLCASSGADLFRLLSEEDWLRFHEIADLADAVEASLAAVTEGRELVNSYTDSEVIELVRNSPLHFLKTHPGYTKALAARAMQLMKEEQSQFEEAVWDELAKLLLNMRNNDASDDDGARG